MGYSANRVLAALALMLAALALGACTLLPTPAASLPSAQPVATTQPGALPTRKPTARPAARPTPQPAPQPTARPAPQPTAQPAPQPTAKPTAAPAPAVARIAGFDAVAASELPPEARHTLALLEAGGPFPYRQDGAVFQNRERRLPRKAAGYYHEYTVVTPGSGDRGARRIIAGGAGELFYTADHYDTFVQVLPE